jgi:hypothetical protein
VRQQIDSDPNRLDFFSSLENLNSDAHTLERQRECETTNAPTNNENFHI